MNNFSQKKPIITFLKYYLPYAVILSFLFILVRNHYNDTHRKAIEEKERNSLFVQSGILNDLLSQYIIDLETVSDAVSENFSSDNEEYHKYLKSFLSAYLKEEITVENLKLLDHKGNVFTQVYYNNGSPIFEEMFTKADKGELNAVNKMKQLSKNIFISSIYQKTFSDGEVHPLIKFIGKIEIKKSRSDIRAAYIVLEVKLRDLFAKNPYISSKSINKYILDKDKKPLLEVKDQFEPNESSNIKLDTKLLDYLKKVKAASITNKIQQIQDEGLHTFRKIDTSLFWSLNELNAENIVLETPFIFYSYIRPGRLEIRLKSLLNLIFIAVIVLSGILIFFLSVTRVRKIKAELQLAESEELILSISNSLSDALVVTNKDNSIKYWSKSAERIFGYSAESIVEKDIKLVFASEKDGEKITDVLGEVNTKSKKVNIVLKQALVISKSGSRFPAEFSISSFQREGESGAVSIIRDITDRTITENRLVELESKFHSFFNTSAVGVVLLDMEENLLKLNHSFAEMLDYEEEELLGIDFNKLTAATKKQHNIDQYKKLRAGLIEHCYLERKLINRNGKEFEVSINASSVKNKDAKVNQLLLLIQDIAYKKSFTQSNTT